MKTRRGSLLWSGTHGDAILMYKPGDVVKPVTVLDQFFTGVVRNVDTKTNKITVAWGGGPESQHDVDEIMPMPFFDGQKNKDAIKTSSCRRMRADASDVLGAKVSEDLGNVKTLEKLDRREVTRALREAIISEEQAINQYETIADSTGDSQIRDVVQDIANEEKVHVGELQGLLVKLLDDEQEFLDEGSSEVNTASERIALNPPDEQYCGEFQTHGLDDPRGGGFSIMKDLAYELHDEANDFADVNPKIATGSDEPPAQRMWEEEIAKKSSVSTTASECGCLGLDGLRSRRAMYWCAPDRTFRLTQQEQQSGSAMCPKCRCEMNREKFTRSDKLLMCPTCGFKVPTSKAVTKPQVEIKVPDGVNVQVTHQDECGEDVCGEMINGSRRGKMAYADPKELEDLPRMSLSQIAMIVYKDWKAVNYAAKPYLQAMSSLHNVSDMYGMDSGSSIVAYFLSNATSWKGDIAKVVKKELNRRIR
jgi:predicted RNA-binding Zn-ribbon protein involved in translation (DUF1610 family)